jgi:serine/threonine-protein kinase
VILRIILDVLAGLSALHASTARSRPIVHGDVAPTNIVISYRGDARLVHSGLSSVTSRVGVIGQRNGRLPYKAPEQLRTGVNAVPIDPSADVFAAGVLLWEALQGERLFDADSDVAVVERILYGTIQPLQDGGDRYMPIALLPLVTSALDRDPDGRFSNAAQLGEAITRAPGVRLATTEEVALVVDQLLGTLMERRREQIEEIVAQADQRPPSEGSLRAGIDSQLRSLRPTKTPVGFVYPPPSTPPAMRPLSNPPSERFPVPSYSPPSRIASSHPRLVAEAPASSRVPSPRPPPPGPDSPRPSSAWQEPTSESSTIGWIYYIALGAILGTLVFVLVSGPARRDVSPSLATSVRPSNSVRDVASSVEPSSPPAPSPPPVLALPKDEIPSVNPEPSGPASAGEAPAPTSSAAVPPATTPTARAIPKKPLSPVAPKPAKPASSPETDIPSGI